MSEQATPGSNSRSNDVFQSAALSERTFRLALRSSLICWAEYVTTGLGLRVARHQRFLLNRLISLTTERCDRLIIMLPPGYAKSFYTSVLFPAWWYVKHPKASIILVTHNAALSRHFAKKTKELISANSFRLGYQLGRNSGGSDSWQTTGGGEYFSSGVRGSVIGRRADLIIIDDPIRSQSDADNIAARNSLWDWFRTDLVTRLKPGGRVVIAMTRWHRDDLIGRMLEQPDEKWTTLELPALARADDPLGREVGQPLWPEWENQHQLDRKRQMLGERSWNALFQQNPSATGGLLFSVSEVQFEDAVKLEQQYSMVARAWDLAATQPQATDPDWTVGVKLARDSKGAFVVLDVVRFRGGPRAVEDGIMQSARDDGPHVQIGLPEDPGQAGKSQVAYLTARLAGHSVVASRETGSKITRASPAASPSGRREISDL